MEVLREVLDSLLTPLEARRQEPRERQDHPPGGQVKTFKILHQHDQYYSTPNILSLLSHFFFLKISE